MDSGERYVNFTFSEGFSRPVYVATNMAASNRHEVLSKVEENRRTTTPMAVKIDEDPGIQIYREKQ